MFEILNVIGDIAKLEEYCKTVPSIRFSIGLMAQASNSPPSPLLAQRVIAGKDIAIFMSKLICIGDGATNPHQIDRPNNNLQVQIWCL